MREPGNHDNGASDVWALRPYLTGLETSWRLVGDSSLRDVAATSPGDKPGLRGVAEKSNMFDFYGDFFQSPAGRGDVSISCRD